MRIKKIYIVALLFPFLGAYGQQTLKSKNIYLEDFKWTINIPPIFNSVNIADWNNVQARGKQSIEQTYRINIKSKPKTLFVYKTTAELNYFESNWQSFRDINSVAYEKEYQKVNYILYKTIQDKIPNAKIDSATSQITIDKVKFKLFSLTASYSNHIFNIRQFKTILNKKQLSVNITYLSKDAGDQLLTAFLNSKFGFKN